MKIERKPSARSSRSEPSSDGGDSALQVFVSSTMTELRDLREMLENGLNARGLAAQIFENSAGARPETVEETSLEKVRSSDVYVGIFWKQ